MNANRKADLQRKLTLAPVPKPPAGLAERIKREIPKELRFNAEKERERLSKAVAFNLRVAASILILVSSAYLGLQLLSRLEQNPPAAQEPARIPAAYRAQPQAVPKPALAKGKEEAGRRLDVAPAAPLMREKQAAKRDRPETPALPPATASAPEPPPPQPVMAESRNAVAAVAMDRVEQKSALVEDNEVITTSPVSGKEMRYSANKNSTVVLNKKLQDAKLTPWAKVPPAAKLKILQSELAAGADKAAVARVAREAGLNAFADSIKTH
ncbi:MAG TPA: hypothetical protein VER58_09705 [Thermoanaerobaculia bacterium]|nr:hypothetical protein [Thermoanaerobaculia bacterium]